MDQIFRLWEATKKHKFVIPFIPLLTFLLFVSNAKGAGEAAIMLSGWGFTIGAFLLQVPVLSILLIVAVAYVFQEMWLPYVAPLREWLKGYSVSLSPESNTQLLFNDRGKVAPTPLFSYNRVQGVAIVGDPNNPGDITLGDHVLRAIYPHYDLKENLGLITNRFNQGWIHELHVQHRISELSSPPTESQLDLAFGTRTELGQGFVGMVMDPDQKTWLCVTSGDSWHCLEMARLGH